MNKVRDWLYIGNADHARRAADDGSVDAIISLTPVALGDDEHHTPMQDSEENTQEAFDRAVETALEAVESHDSVLIHCSAGVSRSGSVTATVLAVQEGLTFEEALKEVKSARPTVNPHPQLEEQAREYLNEDGPFSHYKDEAE